MAAGSLGLQMPMEVQAAAIENCQGSVSHIVSEQVTAADGKISVAIEIAYEGENNSVFSLYVLDEYWEIDPMYGDWSILSSSSVAASLENLKESGTYTFDNLAGGKTYYVYCQVCDKHADNEAGIEDEYTHLPMYLGSNASADASVNSSSDSSQTAAPSDESTAVPGMPAVYEVKRGDCLSKIAKANNITLAELLAKNPEIKNPDKIWAGQKINL